MSLRIRTGIDVASIEDVTAACEDRTMLDEHWTPRERVAAEGRPERLAGQWAAKEAVMKLLHAGIGEIDLRDIEIVSVDGSAPVVNLTGSARRLADSVGLVDISVSITHERGMAAAVAVGLLDAPKEVQVP